MDDGTALPAEVAKDGALPETFINKGKFEVVVEISDPAPRTRVGHGSVPYAGSPIRQDTRKSQFSWGHIRT
jgi:hypothetical protein